MLNKISIVVFLFNLLASIFNSNAQTKYWDNTIYDNRVKTILLTKLGTDDRYPIILLNTNDQLNLSFDILDVNNENFQYTIYHCSNDWQLSTLNQSEYIQGMLFDQIKSYQFSNNTYTKYVHYSLAFPNENIRPSIAGNYILKVYRNFDENDLVLTRRFMVMSNGAIIDGQVHIPTLAEFHYTKQELNFTIDINQQKVPNPMQDVKVVVLQNSRWDNALIGLKPQFILGTKLDYNYTDKTLFKGSNEFRFFDIRSLRSYSQNVKAKWIDSVVHVMLNYDQSRGSQQYFQYIDYNGKRVLQNKDGSGNPDTDADYAWITFYLSQTGSMPAETDVFLFGELTDWKISNDFKMSFNNNRNRYELETPLKQGRYEYFYVTKDENNLPDECLLEGCYASTENEYLILAYTKNQLLGYDELIGSKVLKSN